MDSFGDIPEANGKHKMNKEHLKTVILGAKFSKIAEKVKLTTEGKLLNALLVDDTRLLLDLNLTEFKWVKAGTKEVTESIYGDFESLTKNQWLMCAVENREVFNNAIAKDCASQSGSHISTEVDEVIKNAKQSGLPRQEEDSEEISLSREAILSGKSGYKRVVVDQKPSMSFLMSSNLNKDLSKRDRLSPSEREACDDDDLCTSMLQENVGSFTAIHKIIKDVELNTGKAISIHDFNKQMNQPSNEVNKTVKEIMDNLRQLPEHGLHSRLPINVDPKQKFVGLNNSLFVAALPTEVLVLAVIRSLRLKEAVLLEFDPIRNEQSLFKAISKTLWSREINSLITERVLSNSSLGDGMGWIGEMQDVTVNYRISFLENKFKFLISDLVLTLAQHTIDALGNVSLTNIESDPKQHVINTLHLKINTLNLPKHKLKKRHQIVEFFCNFAGIACDDMVVTLPYDELRCISEYINTASRKAVGSISSIKTILDSSAAIIETHATEWLGTSTKKYTVGEVLTEPQIEALKECIESDSDRDIREYTLEQIIKYHSNNTCSVRSKEVIKNMINKKIMSIFTRNLDKALDQLIFALRMTPEKNLSLKLTQLYNVVGAVEVSSLSVLREPLALLMKYYVKGENCASQLVKTAIEECAPAKSNPEIGTLVIRLSALRHQMSQVEIINLMKGIIVEMVVGKLLGMKYVSEADKEVFSKQVLRQWVLPHSDTEKVLAGLNVKPDFVIKMSVDGFNKMVADASLDAELLISHNKEGANEKLGKKAPTVIDLLNSDDDFYATNSKLENEIPRDEPEDVAARMKGIGQVISTIQLEKVIQFLSRPNSPRSGTGTVMIPIEIGLRQHEDAIVSKSTSDLMRYEALEDINQNMSQIKVLSCAFSIADLSRMVNTSSKLYEKQELLSLTNLIEELNSCIKFIPTYVKYEEKISTMETRLLPKRVKPHRHANVNVDNEIIEISVDKLAGSEITSVDNEGNTTIHTPFNTPVRRILKCILTNERPECITGIEEEELLKFCTKKFIELREKYPESLLTNVPSTTHDGDSSRQLHDNKSESARQNLGIATGAVPKRSTTTTHQQESKSVEDVHDFKNWKVLEPLTRASKLPTMSIVHSLVCEVNNFLTNECMIVNDLTVIYDNKIKTAGRLHNNRSYHTSESYEALKMVDLKSPKIKQSPHFRINQGIDEAIYGVNRVSATLAKDLVNDEVKVKMEFFKSDGNKLQHVKLDKKEKEILDQKQLGYGPEQLYALLCAQLINTLQGSRIGTLNTSSRELSRTVRLVSSGKRHGMQNEKKKNLSSQLITLLSDDKDLFTFTSTSFPAQIRSDNLGVKMDYIGTLLGIVMDEGTQTIVDSLMKTDPCKVVQVCKKNKEAVLRPFYTTHIKEAMVLVELLRLTSHLVESPLIISLLKVISKTSIPGQANGIASTGVQRDQVKITKKQAKLLSKGKINADRIAWLDAVRRTCEEYLAYIYCDETTELTDAINEHLNTLVDILVTAKNDPDPSKLAQLGFGVHTENTKSYHKSRANVLVGEVQEVHDVWNLFKIGEEEEDTSSTTLSSKICTNWRLTGALALIIGRWFKITLNQSPKSTLSRVTKDAIIDALEINITDVQKNIRNLKQLQDQDSKTRHKTLPTFYMPGKLNLILTEHFTCHLNSVKKDFYTEFSRTCKEVLRLLTTSMTAPLMELLNDFLTNLYLSTNAMDEFIMPHLLSREIVNLKTNESKRLLYVRHLIAGITAIIYTPKKTSQNYDIVFVKTGEMENLASILRTKEFKEIFNHDNRVVAKTTIHVSSIIPYTNVYSYSCLHLGKTLLTKTNIIQSIATTEISERKSRMAQLIGKVQEHWGTSMAKMSHVLKTISHFLTIKSTEELVKFMDTQKIVLSNDEDHQGLTTAIIFFTKVGLPALLENDQVHNTCIENYRFILGQAQSDIHSVKGMYKKLVGAPAGLSAQKHLIVLWGVSAHTLSKKDVIADDMSNKFYSDNILIDPLDLTTISSEQEYMDSMYTKHYYIRGLMDPIPSKIQVADSYGKIADNFESMVITSLDGGSHCWDAWSKKHDRYGEEVRVALPELLLDPAEICSRCKPHIYKLCRLIQVPFLKLNKTQMLNFIGETMEKQVTSFTATTFGDPYYIMCIGRFYAEERVKTQTHTINKEKVTDLSITDFANSNSIIKSYKFDTNPLKKIDEARVDIAKRYSSNKHKGRGTQISSSVGMSSHEIAEVIKDLNTDETYCDASAFVISLMEELLSEAKEQELKLKTAPYASTSGSSLLHQNNSDTSIVASFLTKQLYTNNYEISNSDKNNNNVPDRAGMDKDIISAKPHELKIGNPLRKMHEALEQGTGLSAILNFEKHFTYLDLVGDEAEVKLDLEGGADKALSRALRHFFGDVTRAEKQLTFQNKKKIAQLKSTNTCTYRHNLRTQTKLEITRFISNNQQLIDDWRMLNPMNVLTSDEYKETVQLSQFLYLINVKLKEGYQWEDIKISIGESFLEICRKENSYRKIKVPALPTATANLTSLGDLNETIKDQKVKMNQEAEGILDNLKAFNLACTQSQTSKAVLNDSVLLNMKTVINTKLESYTDKYDEWFLLTLYNCITTSTEFPLNELFPTSFQTAMFNSDFQQAISSISTKTHSEKLFELLLAFGENICEVLQQSVHTTFDDLVNSKVSNQLIQLKGALRSPEVLIDSGYINTIALMGLDTHKYTRFKALRGNSNVRSLVDNFKSSDRSIYVLSRKVIDSNNTSAWKAANDILRDSLYVAVTNIAYKLQFAGARDLVIQDEDTKLLIGIAERISKQWLDMSQDDILVHPDLKKTIINQLNSAFLSRHNSVTNGTEPEYVFVNSSDETKWGPTHYPLSFALSTTWLADLEPETSNVLTAACVIGSSKRVLLDNELVSRIAKRLVYNEISLQKTQNPTRPYKFVKGGSEIGFNRVVKDLGFETNENAKSILLNYFLLGRSYQCRISHMGQGIYHATSSLVADMAVKFNRKLFERLKLHPFKEGCARIPSNSVWYEKRSSDDSISFCSYPGSDKKTRQETLPLFYEMITFLANLLNIRKSLKHLAGTNALFGEVYSTFTSNNQMVPKIKTLCALQTALPGGTPQQEHLQRFNLNFSALEEQSSILEITLANMCRLYRNSFMSPPNSITNAKLNTTPTCFGGIDPINYTNLLSDPLMPDLNKILTSLDTAMTENIEFLESLIDTSKHSVSQRTPCTEFSEEITQCINQKRGSYDVNLSFIDELNRWVEAIKKRKTIEELNFISSKMNFINFSTSLTASDALVDKPLSDDLVDADVKKVDKLLKEYSNNLFELQKYLPEVRDVIKSIKQPDERRSEELKLQLSVGVQKLILSIIVMSSSVGKLLKTFAIPTPESWTLITCSQSMTSQLDLSTSLKLGLKLGNLKEVSDLTDDRTRIKNSSIWSNPVKVPMQEKARLLLFGKRQDLTEDMEVKTSLQETVLSLAFKDKKATNEMSSLIQMRQSIMSQDPNAKSSMNPLQSFRNFRAGQLGFYIDPGMFISSKSVRLDSGISLSSMNHYLEWNPVTKTSCLLNLDLLHTKKLVFSDSRVPQNDILTSIASAEESEFNLNSLEIDAGFKTASGTLHLKTPQLRNQHSLAEIIMYLTDPNSKNHLDIHLSQIDVENTVKTLLEKNPLRLGLVVTTLMLLPMHNSNLQLIEWLKDEKKDIPSELSKAMDIVSNTLVFGVKRKVMQNLVRLILSDGIKKQLTGSIDHIMSAKHQSSTKLYLNKREVGTHKLLRVKRPTNEAMTNNAVSEAGGWTDVNTIKEYVGSLLTYMSTSSNSASKTTAYLRAYVPKHSNVGITVDNLIQCNVVNRARFRLGARAKALHATRMSSIVSEREALKVINRAIKTYITVCGKLKPEYRHRVYENLIRPKMADYIRTCTDVSDASASKYKDFLHKTSPSYDSVDCKPQSYAFVADKPPNAKNCRTISFAATVSNEKRTIMNSLVWAASQSRPHCYVQNERHLSQLFVYCASEIKCRVEDLVTCLPRAQHFTYDSSLRESKTKIRIQLIKGDVQIVGRTPVQAEPIYEIDKTHVPIESTKYEQEIRLTEYTVQFAVNSMKLVKSEISPCYEIDNSMAEEGKTFEELVENYRTCPKARLQTQIIWGIDVTTPDEVKACINEVKSIQDINKIDTLMFDPYAAMYSVIPKQEIMLTNPLNIWTEITKGNKMPLIKTEDDCIKMVQMSALVERPTMFEQLTDCLTDGKLANVVTSRNIELFMTAADVDMNAFITDFASGYGDTMFVRKIAEAIKGLAKSKTMSDRVEWPKFQDQLGKTTIVRAVKANIIGSTRIGDEITWAFVINELRPEASSFIKVLKPLFSRYAISLKCENLSSTRHPTTGKLIFVTDKKNPRYTQIQMVIRNEADLNVEFAGVLTCLLCFNEEITAQKVGCIQHMLCKLCNMTDDTPAAYSTEIPTEVEHEPMSVDDAAEALRDLIDTNICLSDSSDSESSCETKNTLEGLEENVYGELDWAEDLT
jgi:hypothetical protein